jgi:hypothetical protein
MGIMRSMGMSTDVIRAGHANLFLSPVFRQTLATISGATIELYDTDGAAGAARGAAVGAGLYGSVKEACFAEENRDCRAPCGGERVTEEACGAGQNRLKGDPVVLCGSRMRVYRQNHHCNAFASIHRFVVLIVFLAFCPFSPSGSRFRPCSKISLAILKSAAYN